MNNRVFDAMPQCAGRLNQSERSEIFPLKWRPLSLSLSPLFLSLLGEGSLFPQLPLVSTEQPEGAARRIQDQRRKTSEDPEECDLFP